MGAYICSSARLTFFSRSVSATGFQTTPDLSRARTVDHARTLSSTSLHPKTLAKKLHTRPTIVSSRIAWKTRSVLPSKQIKTQHSSHPHHLPSLQPSIPNPPLLPIRKKRRLASSLSAILGSQRSSRKKPKKSENSSNSLAVRQVNQSPQCLLQELPRLSTPRPKESALRTQDPCKGMFHAVIVVVFN